MQTSLEQPQRNPESPKIVRVAKKIGEFTLLKSMVAISAAWGGLEVGEAITRHEMPFYMKAAVATAAGGSYRARNRIQRTNSDHGESQATSSSESRT